MNTKSKYWGIACLLFLAVRSMAAVYYVNSSNLSPAPPFSTWDTAATNIQDAIDVSTTGDTVLVTNGTYAYGGRIMAGDLVNRVALTNSIIVQSVNGPYATIILGAGATNGTNAVRCAWLTNGAALVGFTLTGGATRTSGDSDSLLSGGGVWCSSTNSLVIDCLICSNTAAYAGSGACRGSLRTTAINGNRASYATYNANLYNCTVIGVHTQ